MYYCSQRYAWLPSHRSAHPSDAAIMHHTASDGIEKTDIPIGKLYIETEAVRTDDVRTHI